MVTQTLLEITNDPYIIQGGGVATAVVVGGAIAGAVGGLVKGIGSLFGRRRKSECSGPIGDGKYHNSPEKSRGRRIVFQFSEYEMV